MARPGLGTKRLCPHCGAKFYDLDKDPIVCAKCGSVVESLAPVSRGGRPAVAPRAAEPEAETPELQDAEFVSLEEADAEAAGPKSAPEAGEEDEDVELAGDSDETFLEADEDEDADVTDIIGGDIEDEEET